mgnify:FL=1
MESGLIFHDKFFSIERSVANCNLLIYLPSSFRISWKTLPELPNSFRYTRALAGCIGLELFHLVFIRVSSVKFGRLGSLKFSSLSTVRWFNDMQPIWSFALCGIRRRTNQYSSKRLLSRHNARSLISNLS